jgi:hypothetical protein
MRQESMEKNEASKTKEETRRTKSIKKMGGAVKVDITI